MADCKGEQKMSGMVALVTGSSSGIGAGIAVEFSRLGAQVTITGRQEDKLKEVAKKCQEASSKNHQPLIIVGDVSDEGVRKKLVDDTIKQFGRLDVLINNAGYYKSIPATINDGLATLDDMLDIHVRVPYHLSKLALPYLTESKGAVINISSVASFKPCSKVGIEYGVAKAAMDQVTKWFAYELGSLGVRVNSINPGVIPTDLILNAGGTQQQVNHLWESSAQLHALKRVGRVDEVAKVAAFFATQESSFVTGTILPVDGGYMVVPNELEL